MNYTITAEIQDKPVARLSATSKAEAWRKAQIIIEQMRGHGYRATGDQDKGWTISPLRRSRRVGCDSSKVTLMRLVIQDQVRHQTLPTIADKQAEKHGLTLTTGAVIGWNGIIPDDLSKILF